MEFQCSAEAVIPANGASATKILDSELFYFFTSFINR